MQTLFVVMKNADTVMLAGTFSDGAILQTISNDNGIVKVRTGTVMDIIAFVSNEEKGNG